MPPHETRPRHPLRRRRHAALAAVARAAAQTASRAHRRAHHDPGDRRAPRGVRGSHGPCGRLQRSAPIPRRRTAARDALCRPRRSCSSRSGATRRPPSRWPRTRRCAAGGEDALMLVLPADHVLQDLAAFQASIRTAMPAAGEHGKLVAFGIVARTPETGYGYHSTEPARRHGAGALPSRNSSRSRTSSARRRIRRLGRLLLELRHVPVRRAPFSRRARTARARHRGHLRARQRHARVRDKDFTRVDEAVFASLPQRIGRLRGHGKDPRCGHGAARRGLERRGFLGRAARRVARGRATAT